MPNFLTLGQAKQLHEAILHSVRWQQEQITLFGKTHDIPRLTAWYGDEGAEYEYSGVRCVPEPWTEELRYIKSRIENYIVNESFNSVLLNLYRNGLDKMGWHADNEKSLGQNPTIASVSLGATRKFDLKHRTDKSQRLRLELTSGSLLIMSGDLQHHFLHQIPMQKRVTESRINLTYRTVVKELMDK